MGYFIPDVPTSKQNIDLAWIYVSMAMRVNEFKKNGHVHLIATITMRYGWLGCLLDHYSHVSIKHSAAWPFTRQGIQNE